MNREVMDDIDRCILMKEMVKVAEAKKLSLTKLCHGSHIYLSVTHITKLYRYICVP